MCILREEYNKIIVTRWFAEYWGENYNSGVVAELASPDIRMVPSLHRTRAGRLDVTMFMSEYRAAFPDFCVRPMGNLIADGDQVVVRWEGGGTHTGKTMGDFATRILREGSGRRMSISGTTILTVKNGRIDREQILFDGVAAMQQLGLMRPATSEEWASNQELFLRYPPQRPG
jgi:predicted ester cyclase